MFKCQGKQIRPEDEKDCDQKATGMFLTRQGTLPFCTEHSTWAKQRRIIIRKPTDYYGLQ